MLTEKIVGDPRRRQGRSGGDARLLRADPPARLRVQRHGPARVLLRKHDARAAAATPRSARSSAPRSSAASGSYEIWKTDFVGVGKMRGVGWAICYLDPATGRISNHWITLHETGNVAGFGPLLVMDVWEHAFLLDYKPAERAEVHRGVPRQRRLGGRRAPRVGTCGVAGLIAQFRRDGTQGAAARLDLACSRPGDGRTRAPASARLASGRVRSFPSLTNRMRGRGCRSTLEGRWRGRIPSWPPRLGRRMSGGSLVS